MHARRGRGGEPEAFMASWRAVSLSILPVAFPRLPTSLFPCILQRSQPLPFLLSPPSPSSLHFCPYPPPASRLLAFAAKTTASNAADQSPYDVLGVEWSVGEDGIKAAYRRMVKQFHPDVFDGSVQLEEGETAEARFIKIQAAYELLVDKEQRRQYDHDNRINPLKASKAWMDWILKKKKAFEQRGDLAVSAWAEQQQREMSLKARRLSKYKMDPEEERRILSKERQASIENFENTLRRHTLVLKKRDLLRRKTDANAQKKAVKHLLAAEGLELADESDLD